MELTVYNITNGANTALSRQNQQRTCNLLPYSNQAKVYTSVFYFNFLVEILFLKNISKWIGYILISFMNGFCYIMSNANIFLIIQAALSLGTFCSITVWGLVNDTLIANCSF